MAGQTSRETKLTAMDRAVELLVATLVELHGEHARCLIVTAPEGSRYEVTVPRKLPRATRPPPKTAA